MCRGEAIGLDTGTRRAPHPIASPALGFGKGGPIEPANTSRIETNHDKPPLSHDELRDVIDLSLWAGQMLLQYGATSQRIEETVHRFGTSLGCDWLDILVSPNVLIITANSGVEFRTKTRRVVQLRVDLNRVTAISDLSHRLEAGDLDRFQVRVELQRIDQQADHYNRWLLVGMAGLACGAFSRLFGGDWTIFGITYVASATAMVVRQELTRLHFNPLLIVAASACVAGMIAGGAGRLQLSPQPDIALTASVLFLVPGVPLINAALDLIRGNMLTGLARGATGLLISLAIALGLLLAMRVMGVPLYG